MDDKGLISLCTIKISIAISYQNQLHNVQTFNDHKLILRKTHAIKCWILSKQNLIISSP